MSDQLDRAARDLAEARAAVVAATDQVREAVLAVLADGAAEAPVARRAGVDRMTVRKWRAEAVTARRALDAGLDRLHPDPHS